MIFVRDLHKEFCDPDFSKETDCRFKITMFQGCCTVRPFDIKNSKYLSCIDEESKRRYNKSYEEMIPEIIEMFYSVNLLTALMCGDIKNEEELKKRVAEECEMDERYGIFR